jgi:hypothetical protein
MLAASATWPTAELLLKFCKTDPNLKSWFAKTVSRYQTFAGAAGEFAPKHGFCARLRAITGQIGFTSAQKWSRCAWNRVVLRKSTECLCASSGSPQALMSLGWGTLKGADDGMLERGRGTKARPCCQNRP